MNESRDVKTKQNFCDAVLLSASMAASQRMYALV